MEGKKLVPQLRFSGFEGEWEEKKIGNITQVTSGGTPSSTTKEFWFGDIPWMNSGELNLKRVYEVDNRITQLGLNKSSAKIIPEYCVLIGLAGQGKTRGTAAMNMIELCTNQSVAAILPNSKYFEPEFLYQNIDSRYEELRRLSTGDGGRGGLNLQIIKGFKVFFPKLKEQQKIASFFTAVDQRIQAFKKKQSLLESYKKGMMQKVFSQEIRFRDDQGNEFEDWEVKKAKKVFHSHSNKKHKGDLPILSASQEYGMIYREGSGIKIQASEKSVLSYKVVEPGDFIISLRSFQGGLDYSTIKGICSPAYTILKNSLPIDYDFYRFYFKKEDFIERLSKTVVGIRDGKQISYDAFGTLTIPYPSLKEQQKIASFLSGIDEAIEKVALQVEKMGEFKKGLLQRMFV